MSKRLEKIASYVHDGIGVADVGTDHGYILVMLAERGYKGRLIGTDINSAPLKKAEINLREAGLEDRAELVLCDGLDGCRSEDIDTIIVAGMGGDTITGILDRAEWCAREDISLILQPVTKPEILRYWLTNNDYIILDDALIDENGMLNQIIYARPGKAIKYSDAELFTGKYEYICQNENFPKLMDIHTRRFKSAVSGLAMTERTELAAWCGILQNILKELYAMKGKHDELR